ncbi:hypothetical protein D9M69_722200 [compost metagenome]
MRARAERSLAYTTKNIAPAKAPITAFMSTPGTRADAEMPNRPAAANAPVLGSAIG